MSQPQNLPQPIMCALCLDTFNDGPNTLCTINCSHHHQFCYPCLMRFVQFCSTASEDTSPHIPACPKANEKTGGCNYVLKQSEVERIFERGMEMLAEDRGIGWTECKEVMKKLTKLYLIAALQGMNCVRCPTCNSDADDDAVGYWVSVSECKADPNTVWKNIKTFFNIQTTTTSKDCCIIDCPRCHTNFCSRCFITPYHFNCTCDEYIDCARNWVEWLGQKQAEYIEEVAKEHEAAVAAYKEKVAAHEKEVQAAKERFEEVVITENYFAKQCRFCPHCSVVIERTDGCDNMVCGRNHDSAPLTQIGCGKYFKWSMATPYVANAGTARIPSQFDEIVPNEVYKVKHYQADGRPLLCSHCRKPIQGPCIQCLHCPAYHLCLECNISYAYNQKAEEVATGNKKNAPQPTHHHEASHVCKVMLSSFYHKV